MKIISKLTLVVVIFLSFGKVVYSHEKSFTNDNPIITYITGTIEKGVNTDTISLVLNGAFYSYQTIPERYATQVLKSRVDQNGTFKFAISTINSPFHVSLFLSSKRNNFGYLIGNGEISNYLIMAGDSIHVTIGKNKQIYSGRGASLFQVQRKVDEVDSNQKLLKNNHGNLLHISPKKWLEQKDSLLNSQLNMLNLYRTTIPASALGIIRADIIGSNRAFVYQTISFTQPFIISANLSPALEIICKELLNRPPYIDQNDRAALSPKYVYYLYEMVKMEFKYARIKNETKENPNNNYFSIINTNYTGLLKDKLLTWWLMDAAATNWLVPGYVTHALSVMQSPIFIRMVENLNLTYEKGQPITDFSFKDTKGRIVHLSDFKNKVLLIDLWFTGCSGCIKVAAGLPFVEEAFKGHGDVVFFSISIDKNKNQWLQSINEKGGGKYFVTPETRYLYTSGTGENNPFIKKYVPDGTYPLMLIIDKKGKIFSSTPTHPVDEKAQTELINEIKQVLAIE